MTTVRGSATVRRSEVLAALSLASDVGHDQPLERSVRNAVVAARLGMEVGLSREELSDASSSPCFAPWAARPTRTSRLRMGGDDRAFAA